MAATSLPLELQQQIFSLLDGKSFHAARQACRWWRFASQDFTTLSRQIRKVPILPALDRRVNPRDLQSIFSTAAHRLMFGLRVTQEQKESGAFRSNWTLPVRPKMAASSDGKRLVTLNGRTIALYDVSGSWSKLLLQRHLNDLTGHVGEGPWLKVTATSFHELALSSDGRLLAVGLCRTIQIYDLSEDAEAGSVNRYITEASEHYISSLAFEQNGHALRVCLSGNASVLYLGSPANKDSGSADVGHWKSQNGLEHTFLNSSVLTLPSNTASRVRISGLQLLQPCRDGWIFGAQRHGGGESSRYILGHIYCYSNQQPSPSSVDHSSVTELARLESFLSSCDYGMSELSSIGMGGWEKMPCAHEHHPWYALQGDLLVVAERDKKCVRPMPKWTQIFVYRVPSRDRILRLIESSNTKLTGEPEVFGAKELIDCVNREAETSERIEHGIARIPLCLDTLPGEVTDIQFTKGSSGKQHIYALKVVTSETTKGWSLVDL